MTEQSEMLAVLKRMEARQIAMDTKLDLILSNVEKLYNDILGILKIIHGVMVEILANLTAESGGDLVEALRKLTEAVNSLGTQISANPGIIVNKIKNELANNAA